MGRLKALVLKNVSQHGSKGIQVLLSPRRADLEAALGPSVGMGGEVTRAGHFTPREVLRALAK